MDQTMLTSNSIANAGAKQATGQQAFSGGGGLDPRAMKYIHDNISEQKARLDQFQILIDEKVDKQTFEL